MASPVDRSSPLSEARQRLESLLLEFDEAWDRDALSRQVRQLPTDDDRLRQHAHVPADHEPADTEDDGLVEEVEREHRLIGVRQEPARTIEPLRRRAEQEDDEAPRADSHDELVEHKLQRNRRSPARAQSNRDASSTR